MRGGDLISTSGAVRKNPKAQMMITQTRAASGRGHQIWTSLDLGLSMEALLLVFNGNQKVLRAGRSRAQHCLHDDTLRRIAVRGYDQFLLGLL